MQEIKGKHLGLWSAQDILYYFCDTCGHHLPWARYVSSNVLVSSCCGIIYNAEPLNGAARFRLSIGVADMRNVITFSVVDVFETPG